MLSISQQHSSMTTFSFECESTKTSKTRTEYSEWHKNEEESTKEKRKERKKMKTTRNENEALVYQYWDGPKPAAWISLRIGRIGGRSMQCAWSHIPLDFLNVYISRKGNRKQRGERKRKRIKRFKDRTVSVAGVRIVGIISHCFPNLEMSMQEIKCTGRGGGEGGGGGGGGDNQ
jgi:hypothetical protein